MMCLGRAAFLPCLFFVAGLARPEQGNATNATELIERQRECASGEICGCWRLGLLYQRGEGVSKDEAKAIELFRKACDGGCTAGCDAIAERDCKSGQWQACAFLAELPSDGMDIEVLVAKVEKLSDQALLAKIATSGKFRLRVIAIERITDQLQLAVIAKRESGGPEALLALSRITDQTFLAQIAETRTWWRGGDALRKFAVRKLTGNQAVLARIVEKDPSREVREAAFEKLTDQAVLAQIAKTAKSDINTDVRETAVGKLTDQSLLAEIARTNTDSWSRRAAAKKLSDQAVLLDVARSDRDRDVREAAIEKLTNFSVLVELVRQTELHVAALRIPQDLAATAEWVHEVDLAHGVRAAALRRLDDQTVAANPVLLRKIVKEADDAEVRQAAASRLTDEALLAKIAQNDSEPSVRGAAVGRLEDQALLAKIALNDSEWTVRKIAVGRLKDQAALAQIANSHDPRNLFFESDMHKIAVSNLTDQAVLAKIAKSDNDPGVRAAAVGKLTDFALLTQVAREAYAGIGGETERAYERQDYAAAIRRLADKTVVADQAEVIKTVREAKDRLLREVAVARLTDQALLSTIAMTDGDVEMRRAAVSSLTDKDLLAKIAKNDPGVRNAAEVRAGELRLDAVRRLTDQTVLAQVAKADSIWAVGRAAVERLNDQALLAQVAETGSERPVREAAVERLNDQSVLARIARGDSSPYVRAAAVARLTDQASLAKIAEANGCGGLTDDEDLGNAALAKLTDQTLLIEIIKGSCSKTEGFVDRLVALRIEQSLGSGKGDRRRRAYAAVLIGFLAVVLICLAAWMKVRRRRRVRHLVS